MNKTKTIDDPSQTCFLADSAFELAEESVHRKQTEQTKPLTTTGNDDTEKRYLFENEDTQYMRGQRGTDYESAGKQQIQSSFRYGKQNRKANDTNPNTESLYDEQHSFFNPNDVTKKQSPTPGGRHYMSKGHGSQPEAPITGDLNATQIGTGGFTYPNNPQIQNNSPHAPRDPQDLKSDQRNQSRA